MMPSYRAHDNAFQSPVTALSRVPSHVQVQVLYFITITYWNNNTVLAKYDSNSWSFDSTKEHFGYKYKRVELKLVS